MIKIGVIRERKIPADARTPLTPTQCLEISTRFAPIEIVVEPSPVRCFSDADYQSAGITLQDDLSDCDILLGVKEPPIDALIPEKTYLVFSHTIKKQAHNRKLLRAMLEKNIRLIDYEVIVDDTGKRLIAFGFYAGIVGAHNGLWSYGQRTGLFSLSRLHACHDYAEALEMYSKTVLPPVKILLTGGGRVASGAVKNLTDMGIKAVNPADFLTKSYDYPVFTQLHAQDYARRKDGQPFDKSDFYAHSEAYESCFEPFSKVADIFINGIFYDGKAPAFFTAAEMALPSFKIKTIADITCDLVPESSVPSTLKASTIAEPVFGFDPLTECETKPYLPRSIDVMSIDNLPSELPRDASDFFGKQLIDNVLPHLLAGKNSPIICRGMITENGHLTEPFQYLSDYVGAVIH